MQEAIGQETIAISVIIPAYNSEATIAEAIHSVQSQTHKEWEIIVVDDGSTDGTVALVKSMAENDQRIKIITQQNQHVSAARNKGIQNAQYDWLLFLDSDDRIAPQYFEKASAILTSDERIDGVHFGWARITPDGRIAGEKFAPSVPDLFPVLAIHCPFAIHACVIRKALVNAAGGFDVTLKTCEDWDLWQRIARIGARFEGVRELMAFYRMRKHSLSSDGMQFLSDALRVLTQAYAADDRLKHLNLLHPGGEAAALLPARKLSVTTWIAGFLMGNGQHAIHILTHLSDDMDPSLDPFHIAEVIFDSAIIASCNAPAEWHLLYPGIETTIQEFLHQVEIRSKATELAKRSVLILEKMILQHAKFEQPISVGSYHAVCIEITQPIKDIYVDSNKAERLYCILHLEGEELGRIELPVCDKLVSAWVLKDAIAVQFAWQILGRFFKNTIYTKSPALTEDANKSFEDIHNEVGWLTFYRQLWNRPAWEMGAFYDADYAEDTSPARLNESDVAAIEISRELPLIDASTKELHAVYSIGGVAAGVINVPVVNNVVTPAQIRAAINSNTGFELCRICVREALVGTSLTDAATLTERLAAAAKVKTRDEKSAEGGAFHSVGNIVSSQSLLLGRRAGAMNTSAVRRVVFPQASASSLIEMAQALGEPIVQNPVGATAVDRALYMPETISAQPVIPQGNKAGDIEKKVSAYGRQHFEALFSKQPDPWKYTNPYEQTKYEQTLSLLPKQTVHKALEIACAEGHFTKQLAPLVEDLVAVDISTIALERAAARCKEFDHITYGHFDLVKDPVPGKFNLICCSEVLYYVGGTEELKAVANKISGALLPDGYLVMAHAHQVIDEPDKPGFDWGLAFGAKVIGDVFSAVPALQLVKEIHTPLYRVQLFQKVRPKVFSWFKKNKPSIQYVAQPTPVPDAVQDSVRWNGGEPSGADMVLQASTNELPILMYHRVAPDGADNMRRYRVTPAAFEEQLRYLKDSGYYSAGVHDWLDAMNRKRPLPGLAVVFTFDDAYQDFYEYAWPLLKKYDFTAIVFLVADHVGQYNSWDEAYKEKLPLMGWKEILELEQEGVAFGSHSATHKPLTSLSPAAVVREAAGSKTELQRHLQKPVNLFAYPYGDTDAVIAHLIGGCGYTAGFSCDNKRSSFRDEPMRLPRIEVEGTFSLKDFIAKLG